ncbi:MAG TPA: hypothetical protein VK543_18755 [Puia sp.]|nr:hypothetical protein [Puia sp.]
MTDVASWVGLGWALDAGGTLRRTVLDCPDENANGYLNNTVPTSGDFGYPLTSGQLNTLISYTSSPMDGQPDVFSYSLNNTSGNFVFNRDKINITTIPLDNVKIIQNIAAGRFDIVDENGTTYRFGISSANDTSLEYMSIAMTGGGIATATSAWMLKEMISADKSDTIRFFYSSRLFQTFNDIQDAVTITAGYTVPLGQQTGSVWYNKAPVTSTSVGYYGKQQTLREIDFKNGKVFFDTAGSARQDFNNENTLDKIRIQRFDPVSGTFLPLKTVQFYYNYFQASTNEGVNKRLRLDSVKIQDSQFTSVEKYLFGYDTTQNLPGYNSRSRDYWGYYNGKQNSDLIPKQTIQSTRYFSENGGGVLGNFGDSVGSANRDADSNFVRADVLNRIIYPTSGRTDFEYEINRYDSSGITKLGGGLRIRQITSYDGSTHQPLFKRYKYGTNENGLGVPNFLLADFLFYSDYTQNTDACYEYFNDIRTYGSSPNLNVIPFDGSPICYPVVTEYLSNDVSNGKTIYTFQFIQDQILDIIPVSPKYYKRNNFWQRGQLLQKQVFDNNNNLLYILTNTYSLIKDSIMGQMGFQAYLSNKIICGSPELSLYRYFDYSIESGLEKLLSSQEITYDILSFANGVTKTTNYTYNPLNYNISKAVSPNSKGENEIDNYVYPLDYSITGTPSNNIAKGIQNLQTNHIIAPIIENYKQRSNADGSNLRTIYSTFTSYKPTAPVPDTIFATESSSAIATFVPAIINVSGATLDINYRPKIKFDLYDANCNLLQQHKVDDISHSYIWDYFSTLPIADVLNASQNNIAYTSFESDGTGNWIINDANRIAEGFTGDKSFSLNQTNSISFLPPVSGLSLIISYWSKSGQLSISGATVVSNFTGLSKNGWTYYEHIVTTTASSIVLSASSPTTIDELRLYPSAAQMTTWTYRPLIGLVSQCSQNNTVTYYTYDTFNRLKDVRDADGNIIKTFEYHYQDGTVTY